MRFEDPVLWRIAGSRFKYIEQEIMMEILKHGSHVEVLEPGWLREKVVKELKGAAKNYKE